KGCQSHSRLVSMVAWLACSVWKVRFCSTGKGLTVMRWRLYACCVRSMFSWMAWAALRASSVGSRFDALHTTGLTALAGREEESELLLRRWSRAKTGEGQALSAAEN